MINRLPPEFDIDQAQACEWLVHRSHGLLALDVGMGKTAVTVMCTRDFPATVICPAAVKYHWADEICKWLDDDPNDITVIEGKSSTWNVSKWNIINYDILMDHSETLYARLMRKGTANIDEIHYCKTVGAARTRVSLKMMRNAPQGIGLSGTPVPNRPIELYPFLKTFKVLPPHADTKAKFGLHFCKGWFTPWNRWDYSGSSNTEELEEILAPVMFRRLKKRKAGELRPPAVLELDLPLDRREKGLSKAEIAKNPNPVAFEALADIMKLTGIRKAPMSAKRIIDVLENEPKVLVLFWHHDVADVLAEKLKDYGVQRIDGKVPPAKRKQIIANFNESQHNRVLLGQISAMGTGTNGLQKCCSYYCFTETPWVPGLIDQAIGRLDRKGQTEVVRGEIHTIHKSIDAYVLHSVLSKVEVLSKLIKETPMSRELEVGEFDVHVRGLMIAGAKLRGKSLTDYSMFLLQKVGNVSTPAGEEPEVEDATEAKPAAAKKKTSKKKTTKKAAEPPKPTIEDVRSAVAAVMQAAEATDAMAIVKSFGATKVSDIKESDYEAVIAACNDVLEE